MLNRPTLALLATLAVFGLACSSGGTATTADDTADSHAAAVVAVGLNQPARDGKFEFVVSSVKCGRAKVGAEPAAKKAQGQFCLVALSVKNIGAESQMFTGSSQKVYDDKGAKFSHDPVAEMYLNEDNPTFLKDVNPGNQIKGSLVFDVPTGTKLTKVELHDSPFSGGVSVSLS